MNLRATQMRYERSGLLAIDPQALFALFSAPASRENAMFGGVEVVDVCGPLTHRNDGWCDSYDAVQARVRAACSGPAKAIVLMLDSPGGDAAGCVDTTRAIRAMVLAAGKPLYAFVSGKAHSACYALATAATHIAVDSMATIGSVGVISQRYDYSAANAARGLRVEMITSGARKSDGHSDAPITEGELAATQKIVDELAGVFFGLVAEMRPALSVESIRALNAGVFAGQSAVAAGLADSVQPFDQLLAMIASPNGGVKPMAATYEKVKADLEELAKGEDANATAAKAALAAMAPKPEEEAETEETPPEEEEEPKPAEGASARRGAVVSARAAGAVAQALAAQAKEIKQLKRKGELQELDAIIAKRGDIAASLVTVLRGMPLAEAKSVIDAMPAPTMPAPAAGAIGAAPTLGAGQAPAEQPAAPAAGGSAPTVSAHAAELDARMGIIPKERGIVRQGNSMIFGAPIQASTAPAAPAASNQPAPK